MGTISLIIGVLGLFITLYSMKMKRNEISHLLMKSYDIGNGLNTVFPDFRILYKDENLAKYVRVYEGCFMNTGNKDIYKNYEDIEIGLSFPENCVVKAVKVVPSTNELNVKATTGENDNKVQFVVKELFKTKEHFEYMAIVESSNEIDDSYNKLQFQLRLPDTKAIQNIDHLIERRFRRYKRNFLILAIVMFLVLLLLQLSVFFIDNDSYLEDSITMALIVSFIVFVLYSLYEIGTFWKYLKVWKRV